MVVVLQWHPDMIFVAKFAQNPDLGVRAGLRWVQTSLMAKAMHSNCVRTAAIHLTSVAAMHLTSDASAWAEDCIVAWPSISSRRLIQT